MSAAVGGAVSCGKKKIPADRFEDCLGLSPCWKKRKYDSSYLTFMLLHHYYRGNNDIKLLDNFVRHVMSFHLMPRLC